MPNQLQKSLQEYLSKKKKPAPQVQSPSTSSSLSSSTTSWILRGCRHPKTPSFAFDDNKEKEDAPDGAATLSDIDRFLLENFKSLYKKEEGEEDSIEIERSHEGENEEKPSGALLDSPKFEDPPEINLCGSHRFFVARASSSGSLIEEARTSSTRSTLQVIGTSSTSTTITTTNSVNKGGINDSTTTASDDDDGGEGDVNEVLNPEDFITVLKYSVSPHDDFKKSMHEMVDARLHHNGKIDWEFMEELLFCYLNLNDKKSYRFILRAFVDLIVVLRENSGGAPAKPRSARSDSGRRRKNNEPN
ncbi:transcription repressor OFP14-like [Coffea arabica]|uniref:Transcription repressor n=1 Tax=Coffea arabica TaxID=13443 RepID=A0ABM4U2M5_COFAR|nr:transcription repressor OFP14 [Coffea arabica]